MPTGLRAICRKISQDAGIHGSFSDFGEDVEGILMRSVNDLKLQGRGRGLCEKIP